MTTPQDIRDFWFGPLDEEGDAVEDRASLWWLKDPEANALIKWRFEPVVSAADQGELGQWAEPLGVVLFTFASRHSRQVGYSPDPGPLSPAEIAVV